VRCREGYDRDEISLPGKQEDFLMAIRGATKNPMIVVLMSGGPVDVSWAKVRENIHIIAVANVLRNYNITVHEKCNYNIALNYSCHNGQIFLSDRLTD